MTDVADVPLQHAVYTGSADCGARLLTAGTLPPGLAGSQDCHVTAVRTILLTRTAAFPGTGGSPGVPAPETPLPSFTGAETLGAGLESLHAPSQQSASASAEDPEAGRQLLASRPGSASGILSQGRRVVLRLNWASVPTHHQSLMCAGVRPMSLEQATEGSVHGLCNN